MLACGVLRLLHNTATTAFFIWVIAGGLDAYAGTYDAIGRRLGLEVGSADALALTAAGLVAWAAFASDRAGARLPARTGALGRHGRGRACDKATIIAANRSRVRSAGGASTRALLALAALAAFVALLASTSGWLLSAVALWLALAWLAAQPDPEPLPDGAALRRHPRRRRSHLQPRRRARPR